jgi:hypothetical protein
MAYTYGLFKGNRELAAIVERERVALLSGLDPKAWGRRLGPIIAGMDGQTEAYQRQELMKRYMQETTGFWELVNQLAGLESTTLSIECTVDGMLLCTIVRCDAGRTENTKSVTMKVGGTGSVQVWTLSWTETAGKKVYTLRPVAPVAPIASEDVAAWKEATTEAAKKARAEARLKAAREEVAAWKEATAREAARAAARAAAAAEHEGGALSSTPRGDMRAMRGLLAEMGALSWHVG